MTLPTRMLRRGSYGRDVTTLQQKLNTHDGAGLVPDGDFGLATNKGVCTFQSRNGLTPDGIVGSKTWSKIDNLDKGTTTPPPGGIGAPASVGGPPPVSTPSEAAVSSIPAVDQGEFISAPRTEVPAGYATFRRTGVIGDNGAVMGELTINGRTWTTVERGNGYTFVRMGTYTVEMDWKKTGRRIRCLRFSESWAIQSHLVHDALYDSSLQLKGCIAPGTPTADGRDITGSEEAMTEVLNALGGFQDGRKCTFVVENNVVGAETKDAWIRRREGASGPQ